MNIQPEASGVRVKFRFRLPSKKDNKRLLKIYSEKWGALMSACMAVKLSSQDYTDLPKLRAYVLLYPTVSDLSPILSEIKSSSLRKMILDVTPLFNESACDLKSFVLLTSGIRSTHFDSKFLNSVNTKEEPCLSNC